MSFDKKIIRGAKSGKRGTEDVEWKVGHYQIPKGGHPNYRNPGWIRPTEPQKALAAMQS